MTDTVSIVFVGDNVAIDHPDGLGSFYDNVREELAVADVRFANVEFPMTDIDGYDPTQYGRSPRRMAPREVGGLVHAGFDVVSLANNHMMDWGGQGLRQTLSVIEGAGIAQCGAGQTAKAAREPAVIERNGISIAFLGYTTLFVHPEQPSVDDPQLATLDVTTSYLPNSRVLDMPGVPARTLTKADPAQLDRILSIISETRAIVDHVIVSWHWGVSWGAHGSSRFHTQRADYQEAVGRACIDAGATGVVGHGPHVLEGIEVYEGRPIFYSLGSFVFWYPPKVKPLHDLRTGAAWMTLKRDGLSAVGFRTAMVDEETRQPRFVSGDEGARVADWLESSSAELGTKLEYTYDGWVLVDVDDRGTPRPDAHGS
jgi:poly-gamma-glutamate capsule biosynthesis protein CapA/YwtB (metallophosphatase superfamily)